MPVDFEAFAATADLLYTSAFLAERYSGVRAFLEAGPVRSQLLLLLFARSAVSLLLLSASGLECSSC